METMQQENQLTVVSIISESVLDTSLYPKEVRISYDWLLLDNYAKGKKWYLGKTTSYGKVFLSTGKYVYKSEFTMKFGDLDSVPRTRENLIAFQCNSEEPPLMAKIIRGDLDEKAFVFSRCHIDKEFLSIARMGFEKMRKYMEGAA